VNGVTIFYKMCS